MRISCATGGRLMIILRAWRSKFAGHTRDGTGWYATLAGPRFGGPIPLPRLARLDGEAGADCWL